MESSLHMFARRTRCAQTNRDIVAAVMDCTGAAVGADVAGCFLQIASSIEIEQTGASDALALRYAAYIESAVDPVHAALVERHVAVRSNDLFGPEEWARQPFFQEVEAAFGLDAYMAAELVDHHGQRGVIGVARKSGAPPFSTSDAQRLQGICLHASVALTRLALERKGYVGVELTAKQREVVRLISHGLTNEQIALACGVTVHAVKKSLERLYAKVHVASRAELVACVHIAEP